METQSFTTGPLYVDPPLRRGDSAFGLMISLFFGVPSVNILSIELFAAPNTGFNTPEDWTRIFLTGPITLEDEDMINIVEEVRCEFPYYQWFVTYQCSEQVLGVTHALYLLDKNRQATEELPLVPNGDWTRIPEFSQCEIVD